MDAYLAAFALAGGYRLVTTDRGFRQFNGLDVVVLAK
jgi:predicted nucleic acid-binding protein